VELRRGCSTEGTVWNKVPGRAARERAAAPMRSRSNPWNDLPAAAAQALIGYGTPLPDHPGHPDRSEPAENPAVEGG
jgi:hypothetical protein